MRAHFVCVGGTTRGKESLSVVLAVRASEGGVRERGRGRSASGGTLVYTYDVIDGPNNPGHGGNTLPGGAAENEACRGR